LDAALAASEEGYFARHGKLGVQRGEDNEGRVLTAFERSTVPVPEWFIRIDRARFELDMDEGVDYVAQTNIGNLYLQIKSSWLGVDKFLTRQAKRRYNQYVAVFAILDGMTDDEVCAGIIAVLFEKYAELLAKRGGHVSKRFVQSVPS
jgi:hypothetical protein